MKHHVALSIVGIDGVADGHYAGKNEQERLVEASDVPWTILRATQFHEFAGQIMSNTTMGPIIAAPVMKLQPIAACEVGKRLAELATGEPQGRAREIAGPRQEKLSDLIRAQAKASKVRGLVVPLRLPGGMGKAMRSGALLPGRDAELLGETFTEWLSASQR